MKLSHHQRGLIREAAKNSLLTMSRREVAEVYGRSLGWVNFIAGPVPGRKKIVKRWKRTENVKLKERVCELLKIPTNTYQDVADKTGKTRQHIHKIAQEHGLTRKTISKRLRKILSDIRAGTLTAKEIAKKNDCCMETVYRQAKINDLKFKSSQRGTPMSMLTRRAIALLRGGKRGCEVSKLIGISMNQIGQIKIRYAPDLIKRNRRSFKTSDGQDSRTIFERAEAKENINEEVAKAVMA